MFVDFHFSSSFISLLISFESAYGDHILSNTHEYGLIETTMTLLISARKTQCLNILENICTHVLFCVISFCTILF